MTTGPRNKSSVLKKREDKVGGTSCHHLHSRDAFHSYMIMKNNIHLAILGLLAASVALGAPRVITYGLAALLFVVLAVKTWSLAKAWAKQ
ncbi:Hypothetical protein CulFRC11_1746 [Corynebacterium ramonii]|uniref:Uncharacterized protein n=2 Tax=Corynebacteriaceae TaxID=1653 RepID=A0ABN4EI17_9CORY|nr:Hypothetical protein CulFRC11_1746 [Corynebacterium ramonii FRC0011]ESU58140.1 hypothetical protein D881_10120 [Corynebacterium ulcerans NCTC 12077]OAG70439.1 hypothetical protein AFK49_003675 [Corynebacterium ulcerans]STC82829.1 Uncharacterised protein [Corynebacterium ulcerans]